MASNGRFGSLRPAAPGRLQSSSFSESSHSTGRDQMEAQRLQRPKTGRGPRGRSDRLSGRSQLKGTDTETWAEILSNSPAEVSNVPFIKTTDLSSDRPFKATQNLGVKD